MTCPFQFTIYKAESKSYRDLPLRYGETSTLFRNESSGEMHGLIRVRQFTISEGHIACRPDQLEDEFKNVADLQNYMLDILGLREDISYRLSLWDENNKEKYIGDHEDWEKVQNKMREILNHLGIKYTEAVGEAAFYGPKLDLQIKNVHGKEDTIITAQIDFSLGEKFGMVYTDKDGQEKHPYIIHRTSIGCYERTLALLIEKYGGAFPVWLAPVPVSYTHLFSHGRQRLIIIKPRLLYYPLHKVIKNHSNGPALRNSLSDKVITIYSQTLNSIWFIRSFNI